MENKKLAQRNRKERLDLIKDLQEKIKVFMKKNALTERKVYQPIGISYATFRNIMTYHEDNVMLPRLDVLYKVENYLACFNG